MTTITLRQAQKLLAFFGGEDCEVTLTEQSQDGAGGTPGLYAHCTEYPEEGCEYLGPTEVDEAQPQEGAAPPPTPHLFEMWWAEYMPEATQARAWDAWIAAPRADVPVVDEPKRHALCGKCMTPHICAEEGPGCSTGVPPSLGGQR